MKVVLFCGGMGMRIRDYSQDIPKPMINIGNKPILWNIMKYYSFFGHTEFILCLGYKGEIIREYFLNYNEYLSNDFTLSKGGENLVLHNSEIHDWKITFVDTGLTSNIAQRLLKVKHYLQEEEYFLANYSDALTDLPLNLMLEKFFTSNKAAAFMSYPSTQSFHVVKMNERGDVESINPISKSGYLINCGYFVFNNQIFNYIHEGEELVEQPFQRMISNNKLLAYPYYGFWCAMDTFKDKQSFDTLVSEGNTPWEIWKNI